MRISDDGIGLPANVDFRNTQSLGMQLVITLVEQLEGSVELSNNNGTDFLIKFPETE